MDYVKYILVFVVLFVHIEAGGHGAKQHNHVKLHVPKFIHYDHHTKLVTIHHHHHKPKKEHHHHHHHHHKPKAPQGHHYHHHHQKTSTRTMSKGHSSHGSHGHHGHHGSQGHSGHHGHHGHGHGHEHKHHDTPLTYDTPTINYQPPNYEPPTVHYEPPTVNYAPPSINYSPSSSNGDDFRFSSSAPQIPGSPKIRGVVHTVKQTKVFDSLPNAFPGSTSINPANTGGHGYEITEQVDEGDDDVYTAVNSLSQTYPSTYGFVRNAGADVNNDPFAEIAHQNNPAPNDNAFQAAPNPTSLANVNSFTSQSDPFQSSIPNQGIQPAEFPSGFEDSNSLTSQDPNNVVGISNAEDLFGDTPVSFNREAGIQQSINTGGVESFVY